MKTLLRRTPLLLLLIGCLLVSSPRAASAQGIVTGTITGTITDASGAVVRDAPVVATNTATGAKIVERPIVPVESILTMSQSANTRL